MTSLYIFLASRCNICFAVSNSSVQKQKPSHDIRMDRCNMLPTPRPKAKALRIHSFLGAQLTRPGPSCQKMYPLLASRWIQASSPLRRRQCVYKACGPPLLLRVSLSPSSRIHSFIHACHTHRCSADRSIHSRLRAREPRIGSSQLRACKLIDRLGNCKHFCSICLFLFYLK